MDGTTSMFGDLELFETQIDSPVNGEEVVEDERDGPLAILRPSTVTLLSAMLNPIKIFPADCGIPRDWRGVAELAGLAAENIVYLEGKSDSTQELLKLLPSVSTSRLKTVKDLKAFLAIIDRFDIINDSEPLMDADIAFYRTRALQLTPSETKYPPNLNSTNDHDLLTYGDISGESTRYDAFILNADEDSDFADEVVLKLETEYNLRMCVRDRDLLPGVMFEHEAIGRLIETRCNRLLVILSPSFLESEAKKFLVSFTQALALESRQRKIIPCMYKRCEPPLSIRYSFILDYNRAGTLWNFWEKLSNSIMTTGQKNGSLSMESSTSPVSTSITARSSLPDYSHWDAKKGEDLPASFDRLSFSSPLPELSLSSSLPQYSTKSSSKKWYRKVISSGKKKKTEKKSSKKQLVNAE